MSVNKLTTALSVIFVVSLVALIGELLYVLWRRRVFRRRIPTANHYGDHHDHNFPSGGDPASSKELLYFFCLKTDSRIEPSGAPAQESTESLPEDDQVIDVFNLMQAANGPSRFLCTIKEEEREDVLESSEEGEKKPKRVCVQACLEFADDEMAVTVDGTTPFSTPCASPSYFTPVASPARDTESGVRIA